MTETAGKTNLKIPPTDRLTIQFRLIASQVKIIKCRAAVAWEPKKPLSIETIEVAPPKANEVRIKIIATGICHSDAHALEGLTPSTMFPVILGHESAGIVESVGDGVTKFKAGDHVIPLYQAQCKKCVYCKNPKTNFCEISKTTLMRSVMLDGTTRFSCNGKTIYHFMGTSTFSEYTVVNDVNLCKINEKAPLNKVCLLGCGIPTGYGAAINTAKVIKCRAAVAWEPKKSLSIETIEVAPPKAHEVRLRVAATGICHTDAHALEGLRENIIFPIILGHESAGIVESVGESVTKFKPGDHVIPLYKPQCTDCKYCKNPKTNLCIKATTTQVKGVMFDGTTRFSCNGKTIYHFMGTSTFSEYTVVNDVNLCKDAPYSTGYGAAINTAKVEPGSVCAIWGLGAIGLAVAMGCKAAGASKIYGIDINSAKFEIGKKFGITDFVNPNDYSDVPIQDVLVEMTKGGCDFTFECIGNVNTMKSAFEASHIACGITTVIGLAPAGQEISIKPFQLLLGRKLQGTSFGGYKSVDSVPSLVDSYMNKKLMVDEFITHRMGLGDILKRLIIC